MATILFLQPPHCQAEKNGEILDFLPAILAGALANYKKLPRPIDFEVALPSIGAINEYIIDLEGWNIPNNGTQAEITTDNLQAAIDWALSQGFNRIVIPDGTYLVQHKKGTDLFIFPLNHSLLVMTLSASMYRRFPGPYIFPSIYFILVGSVMAWSFWVICLVHHKVKSPVMSIV